MDEKKYEILENDVVIASDMGISIALLLINGYAEKFYDERLNLTIREMERCDGNG